MCFDLPWLWIALLNITVIPVIHLGVSWLFTLLPGGLFSPRRFPFPEFAFEKRGRIYEDIFRIRSWKHRVPDAAPWFKGFAKKDLRATDAAFLRQFEAETCRGEAAHYGQIMALMITLLWTPWPAALVIMVYAFLSNIWCIMIQRHTRFRLTRVLETLERLEDPAARVPPRFAEPP